MLIKYKQLGHLVGILDWVIGLLEVLEREAYKDNKTQAVAVTNKPRKERFYERFRRHNGGGE